MRFHVRTRLGSGGGGDVEEGSGPLVCTNGTSWLASLPALVFFSDPAVSVIVIWQDWNKWLVAVSICLQG